MLLFTNLTIDKVKIIAVTVWATVKLPDNAPTLKTKHAPAKFSRIRNNMYKKKLPAFCRKPAK